MRKTVAAVYIYIYIWTKLTDKLIEKINRTYLSNTGLFVEGKMFLADNRVRDG